MPEKGQDVTIVDGSLDFSGGANSYLVPTVRSEANPNGIPRTQLSWMNNCTVRGGGITQRPAWKRLGALPAGMTGLYQGGWLYEPDSERPYLILAISGHIWKVDPDDPSNAQDLSVQFANPQLQVANITTQVVVVLTHNDAVGAGTIIPSATDPVIGEYSAFISPPALGTVRVPTFNAYGGSLGVNITIGASSYTITAVDGFTLGTSPFSNVSLPADIPKFYFCQAEQFLVIQAGDFVSLPLIWDGTNLRTSFGFIGGSGGTTPPGYGQVFGQLPNVWHCPAPLGTLNVTMYAPYTGVIGDQLFGCYGQVVDPSNNTLTTYTNALYPFVVTGIGPGNTVQLTFIGPSYLSNNPGSDTFNADALKLARLYIAHQTPTKGASPNGSGLFEIPPATAMDYYMGRLWYAQGRQYAAGDIVGNQSSGTLAYNFRDSVLKVTENPLAVGGDGFRVPDDSGNIRAIRHAANINTQLGEGRLYIFTRSTVYSLTVPVSRTDWIGADNANLPRQEVVQLTNGAVSDRSIVEQNGDLFFQSLEPSIRSLIVAIRDFSQWGNTPISINENRILKFNNRGLMQFSSGMSFNNRMLQLVLPEESPVGVIHRAVIPLNFDVVSTLENKLPPTWEGMWQGQAILELVGGDFLGLERCFMPVWSENQRQIELWEMTDAEQFEGDDNRVLWYVEFPAYTWGDEFKQKKLIGGELWFDRIFGEVLFSMDWRPDSSSCWYKWAEWKFCTARTSCEDVHNPECLYPKEYCETYKQMMNLPLPPNYCEPQMSRPANIGYQFQCRLTIKGFCRIRGILLKAQEVESQTYGRDMIC